MTTPFAVYLPKQDDQYETLEVRENDGIYTLAGEKLAFYHPEHGYITVAQQREGVWPVQQKMSWSIDFTLSPSHSLHLIPVIAFSPLHEGIPFSYGLKDLTFENRDWAREHGQVQTFTFPDIKSGVLVTIAAGTKPDGTQVPEYRLILSWTEAVYLFGNYKSIQARSQGHLRLYHIEAGAPQS